VLHPIDNMTTKEAAIARRTGFFSS